MFHPGEKQLYMKQILIFCTLIFPALGFAQYTFRNLQVNYLESPEISKAYTFENLRLYPIYARSTFKESFTSVGKYTSLQKALAEKKVRVTEKSSGGTVNTLTIENLSADTVLIVSGDLVKGGKQDRIIQKDILLKPKSGKKDLPVYCVESGRWNESRSISSSAAPAEFKEYREKGSMSLRKVVAKDEDQSKVWSKVDELNQKNKTVTATKTYNALNNSAEYNKKLQNYIQYFKDKFSNEDIIGVIVVSDNRVLGCDMFATHDLFQLQFNSLLHSYASEAILNGGKVIISTTSVKQYAARLMQDEKSQEVFVKEKGKEFSEKNRKLKVSVFE